MHGICLRWNNLQFVLFSGTTESRCSLVCLAVGYNFWSILGKMKDGTPCPPTEIEYMDARCIKGICLVS